jgi:predicted permease
VGIPSNLWGDIPYAARSLSRTPTFTATVVLTLALGIGVNVAIFSLFQQILLRPLPVTEPERLVNLIDPGPKLPGPAGIRASAAGEADTIFSYPMFRDLEREQEAFVGIAAHRGFEASLSTGEQARRETGMFVSGSYFSLLGLRPAVGRLLGPQDEEIDGQADAAVLSYAYWQQEFGGDPGIVGRELIVNGTTMTIVGVAPAGFHGTTIGTRASVFVPITFPGLGTTTSLPVHDSRRVYWVHLFARLEPGGTGDAASAAIGPTFRAILNEFELPMAADADEQDLAAFRSKSLVLEPGARGQSQLLVPIRLPLQLLLGVGGGVLLLVCTNLAGLVLVRGSTRSGEMAVRASMGATRSRLASLLLTESLLLALPAAITSLPVASLTLRALASGVPGIPASAFEANVNLAAALVAIAIALASVMAFSLFPIGNLVQSDPAKVQQVHGSKHTSSKAATRFRMSLATVQIGLSMTLLAMTGLFAQSLMNIARIDLGMDVDSVVTFSISPQASGYSREASETLFGRLEDELAAVPGVSSAASAMIPLFSGGGFGVSGFNIQGVVIEEPVPFNAIGTDFFGTLGIGMLAGRDFRDSDDTGASVVIVNQHFAERFGINDGAIGSHIRLPRGGGEVTEMEIVGLVANAKSTQVTGEITPQLYQPRRQSLVPVGTATFYVRGTRPAEELLSVVRETAARVDPIVPITDLRTMQRQVQENVRTERFAASASTVFAVLATLLAGLGLYGMLAYAVAQRSRELALRVALGATASRIRGGVLRQVAWIASAGIGLGLLAAILLGRAAQGLLFGVGAGNPLALAGAATVLGVVALGAAYVPARRAARIDPMAALRYE